MEQSGDVCRMASRFVAFRSRNERRPARMSKPLHGYFRDRSRMRVCTRGP
jgi:hypothetical protein